MARILVVDDNQGIRQTMACCLPSLGHVVIVAENGVKGLYLANQESPDFILMDVDMPLLSGISVCETLKSDPARSHIPIVMMTGRMNREVMQRAEKAGALGVLSKPFTWDELMEKFGQHLPVGV